MLRWNRWRRQRHAAQIALSKEAVRSFHPILTKEATLLASSLLTNSPSSDGIKYFQRTGTSAAMSILYDYPTVISEDDTIIEVIDNYNKRVAYSAIPGNFLVELFPWMMYIPERSYAKIHLRCLVNTNAQMDPRFAKWKREGSQQADEHHKLFQSLLDRVKGDLVYAFISYTLWGRAEIQPENRQVVGLALVFAPP